MSAPLPALVADRLSRLRPWFRARWKPAVLVVVLAAGMGAPDASSADIDRALRHALEAEHGLTIDSLDPIHWIDDRSVRRPCWSGGSRAALLARDAKSAPRDVYLARVESSPEGAFLRLCGVIALTRTSLADEERLSGDGARLAWLLEAQGLHYRLELADVDAPDPMEIESWSALARWQWRLAKWQESGQLSAIARRSFRIEPAARRVTLRWLTRGASIVADGREVLVPDDAGRGPEQAGAAAESAPLREEPRAVARPGNMTTWAVDRVRALPWVGSDRLQWLKAAAFGVEARLERLMASAAPAAFAREAEREAAAPSPASPAAMPGVSTGGDWPPAPLEPLWSPALEGEGQWRSLESDVFVRQHRGLPAPFTTTFIRPDQRLETARVVVVMWDPRRIQLNVAAGTEEPQSATGEIGSGLIPRSPQVLSRLVGAFNGGFQSVHGAFGTQVDGKLLVPPSAYAATVARFADGAIGLGTWPPSARVPTDVHSFRQNLTPLVADGLLNPYGRQWWGGVPLGWMDVTRTVRSALCETRDGLLGYFYGSRVDHEALGRALLMARCRYGLHLDMNAGHTGFEFYAVVPEAEPLLPAAMLDARWKVEARVPEVPEWRFRSRRLFRNMQLMHFPRYIERQARDFFYLTERSLLPPTPHGALEAVVQVQPVPLATGPGGFPQLASTLSIHPDAEHPETLIRLVALDLKWLSLSLGAAGPVPRDAVLSVAPPSEDEGAGATDGGRVLWVGQRRAHVGAAGTGGHVLAREAQAGARAGWGVIDGEILIYAEVGTGRNGARDAALLDAVLEQLGASERLLAAAPNFIAIKGGTDLGGARVNLDAHGARGEPALHFQPSAWQALRPFFADTPIVDPETWQPHQVESSK